MIALQKTINSWLKKLGYIILIVLWAGLVYIISQILIIIIMANFTSLVDNKLIFVQLVTIIANFLALILIIFGPKLFKRKSKKSAISDNLSISAKELGLTGWIRWRDLGLTIAGVILYLILTITFLNLAKEFLPWFNIDQKQDLGFSLGPFLPKFEMILTFITLVILVPLSEELLFRGYLFGQLSKKVSIITTSLLVSVLFGLAHGSWNVGVDTFALSLAMCVTRFLSGSIYPSILIHMIKNGIAFYALINMIGV